MGKRIMRITTTKKATIAIKTPAGPILCLLVDRTP
jgi:hypothetical protein